MFKTYYQLTKPGIIYGNALTAIGGFLFASKGHVNFWLLVSTLVGISLVIASACVINNYIDRDIDRIMTRTKKRALVIGMVIGRNALIYATVLGLLGFGILSIYTNKLTVIIGLVGYIDYIVLYGWAKRNSIYGTIVGSISGAMPIVAGYCAAVNRFDAGAMILFVILALWQMPHFYAIAMFRYDDYKNAKIPVWPVIKGMHTTKIQILLYIIAFLIAINLLTVRGYTGFTFLLIMSGLSLAWLYKGLTGFKASDDKKWARKMFFLSLIVILALSIMLCLDSLLP